MRLGIGSYTFPWAIGVAGHPPPKPLTACELLQEAKRLGVHIVQVCDNLPLLKFSTKELEKFEQTARELDLQIELGTRGLSLENFRAHLELALRFRCSFLRLVLDSAGDEPSSDEAYARLLPFLAEAAPAGVKIAIENHDRFSCRVLARLVERLGPSHVGICLDTVNSFGALEGPEVVIQTLAPYALNLHIKDFTVTRVPSQMGFSVTGSPVGQGRLDVPLLLRSLQSAGRDCNAVIELWTPRGASLEATIEQERQWAEQSVRHMREYILP